MLSALILSRHSYPTLRVYTQLEYQRSVIPGPLVLRNALIKCPAPTVDKDQTVLRRFEPSSRTSLTGEQPDPWDLRGAKQRRRYGRLGAISLLSPEYLLSVEQRRFHVLSLDH